MKTTAISLFILSIMSALYLMWLHPLFVTKTIRDKLINIGFNEASITNPENKWGGVRFKNLKFGDQQQNSIDQTTFYYNALNIFNKTLEKIELNNVYVSGNINIDGQISINGMPQIPTLNELSPHQFNEISIKNLNVSFLSAHFGGMRGIINLNAINSGDIMTWNGNIDSRQDQIEIIAKINAQTRQNSQWIIDIDIENAKLERNFGKFTRVHGSINAQGNKNQLKTFNTSLNAGAFNTYNTKWQNASITINKKPNKKMKAIIDAKSTGFEGLELNAEAILENTSINWIADIYSDNGETLLNYLFFNNLIPLKKDDLKFIKGYKDINLRLKPEQKRLIFNIKNELQNIDIKGRISKKDNNKHTVLYTHDKRLPANPDFCQTHNKNHICEFEMIFKQGRYILKDSTIN
ncbi:MAG: hypothetical protein AB8B83_02485 [Bdellovibrionales bacterium]